MVNINEDELKMKMESMNIDDSVINEIIGSIKSQPQPMDNGSEAVLFEEKEKIKQQIEVETDWKKRAALAAKLISMDLE
jgi:hypothetical protein